MDVKINASFIQQVEILANTVGIERVSQNSSSLYQFAAGTFRNIKTKNNLLECQKETLILLKTERILGSRTSGSHSRTYNSFWFPSGFSAADQHAKEPLKGHSLRGQAKVIVG